MAILNHMPMDSPIKIDPLTQLVKASDKTIVVVGLPACGKTTVTDLLVKDLQPKRKSFRLFRTDDYMKFEFEESLYIMLKDIKADKSETKVIEGVQGYRLLRKGVQLANFFPELVIVCVADKATRQKRFIERDRKSTGTGKKRHEGFDGMLTKVWNDYMALVAVIKPELQPRFIIYDTVSGKIKQA